MEAEGKRDSCVICKICLERGHLLSKRNSADTKQVPTSLIPWPEDQLRRASVNSFGYGGSNAHVIMDDPRYYTTTVPTIANGDKQALNDHSSNGFSNSVRPPEPSRVFIVSAKDETAAKRKIGNLKNYLQQKTAVQGDPHILQDLAYTLGQRRTHFQWVAATPASSLRGLIDKIENNEVTPSKSSGKPRIGFVFTGQGAQWFAMGRELIATYSVFKDVLVKAEAYLKDLGATWSLLGRLSRSQKVKMLLTFHRRTHAG
jgi:acyl transferase domain-containing protein